MILLILNEADTNVQTTRRRTAFITAVQKNDIISIKLLMFTLIPTPIMIKKSAIGE